MRFLKRLKFLKIQHELSDDSNVIPFTNFNASDLFLTRRVSRTKVLFVRKLLKNCRKSA